MAAPLFLLAQSLTSCGSDDDDGGACTPNQVVACAGPGNCAGTQTCAADGSAFSECACEGTGAGGAAGGGAGGTANAGAAGAAGAGPSPDNPLFDPALGAIGSHCESDADCPAGPDGERPLTCLTQDSTALGEGGPQGGYCTLPCTQSDECAAIDGPSVCGTAAGYCYRLCQPGQGGVKCPGAYQACLPPPDDAQNIGICFPICTSDLSCGDGLFCNLASQGGALCMAEQRTGGDVGAPCSPETEATDCKSALCLTLQTDPPSAFCSDFCTFGNLEEGCGYNPASGAPRETVCGLPAAGNGAVGDLGLCLELCDADGDCGQPDWTCEDLTPEGQTALGRQGQCVPPGGGGADAGVADAGG